MTQNLTNITPVGRIKCHSYDKTHHKQSSFLRSAVLRRLFCRRRFYLLYYALSAWSKSGNIMVWSRSGPVETIPILAPDSFSKNERYSCANFGSLSNSVIPSVEPIHPFNFV